jgi:hypothetical protein
LEALERERGQAAAGASATSTCTNVARKCPLEDSVGRFTSGHVWYRCPASDTQVGKIHNESANSVLEET